MERLLGWHKPGAGTTVRAFGDRAPVLRDATAYHEYVHLQIGRSTIHGALHDQLIGMLSSASGQTFDRLNRFVDQLHRSYDFLHEGAATTSELLFIAATSPENLEVRRDELPIDYRLAVQAFSGVALNPNIEWHPFLRLQLTLAVASACSNTFLLDLAMDRGLVLTMEEDFPGEWLLSPNERLRRVASLSQADFDDLAGLAGETVQEVCGDDSPLNNLDLVAPVL